jgi:hypothetical protein
MEASLRVRSAALPRRVVSLASLAETLAPSTKLGRLLLAGVSSPQNAKTARPKIWTRTSLLGQLTQVADTRDILSVSERTQIASFSDSLIVRRRQLVRNIPACRPVELGG